MAALTDEQKQYIRDNFQEMEYKELLKFMNEEFDSTNTIHQIQHYISRSGLKKKNVSSWFKQGNKPKNYKPIGHEYVDQHGYTMVKVKDSDRTSEKYEPKQKLIWEKHKGKLEEGEFVIFIDGDRKNFSLDNLMKVNRIHLAYMNKHDMLSHDGRYAEIAKALAELEYKMNRVKV